MDVEKQLTKKNRKPRTNKPAGRDIPRRGSPDSTYQASLSSDHGGEYAEEPESMKKPPNSLVSERQTRRTTSGLKRRASSSTVGAIGPHVKRRKITPKDEVMKLAVDASTSSFESTSTLYSPSSAAAFPDLESQPHAYGSCEENLTSKIPIMSGIPPYTTSNSNPPVAHPTPPVYQHPPAYDATSGGDGHPLHRSLIVPPQGTIRNTPYITRPSISTLGGMITLPMIATPHLLLGSIVVPQPITLEQLAYITSRGGLLSHLGDPSPADEMDIDTDEWLDNDYIMAQEKHA